jgi:spermidine synthase
MSILVIVCVLSAAGVALHLALPRVLAWRGVHLQYRTRFGPAIVFDSTDADGTAVRLLNVGGTFQSICYLDDELWSELVCSYHRTFADVLAHAPARKRALVLGGGGYSFPKYLITHDDHMHVDVVEIDPAVTELARRYFLLDRLEGGWNSAERLGLANADGWEWLRDSTEPFDLIVNDAFSGKHPLGALSGEEGARTIHEHLGEDGIYLANVRSKLTEHASVTLVSTTDAFAREFAHVYLLPECPEEPGRLGNNVLVASDRELDCPGAWDGSLHLES